MGLFEKIKGNAKDKGNQSDNPTDKSEPFGEYKLVKTWDYDKAKEEYSLFQYLILHVSPYSGISHGWKFIAKGNKAWALRTSNRLSPTQGNDVVQASPKVKKRSVKSAKKAETTER